MFRRRGPIADSAQRIPIIEPMYHRSAREYSSRVARYFGSNCAMKSSSDFSTVDSSNFLIECKATITTPSERHTMDVGSSGRASPNSGPVGEVMTVPPGHKGILLARLSAPAVGAGVVLGQNHRSGLVGARRGPDRIGRSWRAGHGSANDDNGRDEHDRVANA